MNRPWIYIASAYTKGDVAINTRFQMEVFERMMNDGFVWPYAPLVSHFQHLVFPRPYKDWVNYDLAMLPLMDGCLRLTAKYKPLHYTQQESSGADGEVARMIELGKPVFYSFQDLYDWVRGNKPLFETRRLV